jgi:hypothetical protein
MIPGEGGATLSKETDWVRGNDPYAPPVSDAADSLERPLQRAGVAGFDAQTSLLQVVMGSLLLQAFLQALNAAVSLLLAAGTLENGQVVKLVGVSHVASRTFAVVYLLGTIPFGLFLVRANKNARAFVTEAPADPFAVWRLREFGPAWMFWSFFVPLFNFVRPYQAVKAVWSCSAPVNGGLEAAQSEVLSTWWTAWLLSLAASRASLVVRTFELGAAGRDRMIAVSSLVTVAACLLAMRMIRALHARQLQRAAELWS